MKIFVQESCKKCGGSSWLKAGMIAERSGPKLGAETLSIRGAEEKWIGGATAANINLQLIISSQSMTVWIIVSRIKVGWR